MAKYYAHSLQDAPEEEWQSLLDHLLNTSKLAEEFISINEKARLWGYIAGLLHDIGKSSKEFQNRLRKHTGKVDHSTAGAQYAYNYMGKLGLLLSYIMAGHHGGMPSYSNSDKSTLKDRLSKSIPKYDERIIEELQTNPIEISWPFESKDTNKIGFQIQFFVRMVFSALVDADFLDTEHFMNVEQSLKRHISYDSIPLLYKKLSKFNHELKKKKTKADINVIEARREILKDCLQCAKNSPGLFSLTAPTGSGKTISSLTFALKHALKYGKDRIIYVIPYTSIIEQNTKVFRDILGKNNVVEHHSNYDFKDDEDNYTRLAIENWDAPIIVTTNVQFFESLFASKPSKCRKLHNITNSVVILDEAQMLPTQLLIPTVEAINELSLNYNTSFVLCTATQPALSKSNIYKWRLENVREIISNPTKLYRKLNRVNMTHRGKLTNEQLASELSKIDQVLCIVNTRKEANLIYNILNSNNVSCYHLSGYMCAAHRSKKLEEIINDLKQGKECRVISTSLIEAGVDIDFPIVYKSIQGIDSIAQAAGRCNRSGLLRIGEVYTFIPEKIPKMFKSQVSITKETIRNFNDILSLEAVEQYFLNLYKIFGKHLDDRNIMGYFGQSAEKGEIAFREISSKYNIIENEAESIIIPYDQEANKIIHELRRNNFTRSLARKAQPYVVQIYPYYFDKIQGYVEQIKIESISDTYYVLDNRNKIYTEEAGLNIADIESYRAMVV